MGISISDPVSAALSLGGALIDRLFPDPTAKAQAQLALLQLQQQGQLAQITADSGIISAQSANIQAEAKSESWLAESWRPIAMLVFVGLITARWFGWSAPNLSQAEALKLWDIVQLGLGGYVIGRSVEKIAPHIASAFSGKDQ